MSLYMQFDEAGPCLQVASNSGWSEFGDWVETLSGYTRLAALWSDGSCEDIAGLRDELEHVLENQPPPDKDVHSVVDGLIHAIDAGGKADIVLITAGVGVTPEKGKEEEGASDKPGAGKKPAKKKKSVRIAKMERFAEQDYRA